MRAARDPAKHRYYSSLPWTIPLKVTTSHFNTYHQFKIQKSTMYSSTYWRVYRLLCVGVITFSYLFLHILIVPWASLCFFLYRLSIKRIARILRPDLTEFLPGVSNVFALTDVTKNPKVNLCMVVILDGPIDVDQFRSQFSDRISSKRKPNGALVYPELRQSWTHFLGYYFWQWDPNFNLKNHIRRYDYQGDLNIPSPSNEQDMERTMGGLLSKSWTKGQSPWEFLVVPDYHLKNNNNDVSINNTALILRAHHVMGDGFTFIKIFLQDFTNTIPPHVPPKEKPKTHLNLKSIMDAVKIPWDVAYATSTSLVDSFSWSNPWHFLFSKLSREFHTSISRPIPTSDIKFVKNTFNVSYAAVLGSAVAGAVARIMEMAGQPLPESITCLSPMPFPDHPGGFVNHAWITFLRLPLKLPDPIQRMSILHASFQKSKEPAYMIGQKIYMNYIGLAPILHNRFFKTMLSSTLGLSIFAVPEPPPKFLGRNLVDVMAGFGLGTSRAGAFGLVVSMKGFQRFVFNIDKNVFHDGTLFREMGKLIEEELQTLIKEAKAVHKINK